MNPISSRNIFDAFEKACKEHPQNIAIFFKQDQRYDHINYQELYTSCIALGKLLIERGIKKADTIALILENNLDWPIAFFGIMYSGAKAIPLSTQLDAKELNYFLNHSDSNCVITSSNLYLKVSESLKEKRIPIICLDSEETKKNLSVALQNQMQQPQVDIDTIASIVYTSGTTEIPRGVILTHKNLLSNVESLKLLNILTPGDCLISILPLHHTYPFMVNLLLPLIIGAKISYPSHIELSQIIECLQKTNVTIMVCVPRLIYLLHQRIKKAISSSPVKGLLVNLITNTTVLLRKFFEINPARSILKELHSRFGKDFRLLISGGARLNPEMAKDFYRWGFTILEGYGLTETSPVATFNRPDQFRFGSVGKAVDGVEIRIDNPDEQGTGEILIRGENVTSGYYKEEQLTNQAIKDGWLFSGDLGYKDKEGFVYITGRKKEMIVLSSGKNINPEEVESYYTQSPYIEEMCVFLSESEEDKGKDMLSAVIYPNYKQFTDQGVTQIKDKLRWEIETLSKNLTPYKRIKRYTIIKETLPRTLLGKLKRYEVEKRYAQFKEERKKPTRLLAQDAELLSSDICQKALRYLSSELKKTVYLDDHLELDLGLDSLDQIGLFLKFQDVTGVKVDEAEFLGVFTVRDVLNKLKATSQFQLIEGISVNWQEVLNSPLKDEIKKSISLKFSPLEKAINFFFVFILKIIAKGLFFLKVKGKKNIPLKGPFILCPNHFSYLDGPLVASSLGLTTILNTYFLGYTAYFKHPLIRWADKLLRLIPVDPASNLTESLKTCSFILNNSKILCMFPEGNRSLDGKIGEFKRGIGILIKELDIDVVPVYIEGTQRAWPAGLSLPRPARVTIVFGKKVTLKELIRKTKPGVDIYKNIVDNLREKVMNVQRTI